MSKYRAQRTEYAGVMYASRAEAAFAKRLDLLVRLERGSHEAIDFWVPQPKFRLGCPENIYVADFLVVPVHKDAYVVDVKGMETQKFKRDRKLWIRYGPCDLVVAKPKYRKGEVTFEFDTITPEAKRGGDE